MVLGSRFVLLSLSAFCRLHSRLAIVPAVFATKAARMERSKKRSQKMLFKPAQNECNVGNDDHIVNLGCEEEVIACQTDMGKHPFNSTL